MLKITYSLKPLADKIRKLELAVQDKAFDAPVERAAWRVFAAIVAKTPKRWFGALRKAWRVRKPGEGARVVENTSKIMLFIEGGTGNAGTPTSNGGYIYPKTKRVLFIPLTASVAMNGYRRGLVFGKDFVMAKRVRGIKAQHIIENFKPEARRMLREEMKAFLERAFK